MPLRRTSPTVPPELTARFGEPELVLGPNLRFRVVAAICGLIFVVMGIILFLMGLRVGLARLPLADLARDKLAVPLVVFGVVILIGTWVVPRCVFVWPGGAIRTLGTAWHGIGWADVERFEDVTHVQKGVTSRG